MYYQGDGLSRQVDVNSENRTYQLTVSNRSAAFELPTLVNIGFAYDWYPMRDSVGSSRLHRVSPSVNYTSNSFSNDQGMVALEYAWREMLMVRGGMMIERGIFTKETRVTAYTGPAFGVSLELPFNEKKSTFAIDYSYRFTEPFGGTQTVGLRINL